MDRLLDEDSRGWLSREGLNYDEIDCSQGYFDQDWPKEVVPSAGCRAGASAPGRWQGFIDSVDEVIAFLDGKRPNLVKDMAQGLQENSAGFAVVAPPAPAPREAWHPAVPVSAEFPKRYEEGMEFGWKGHSARVTPRWTAGVGRALDGAVVYDMRGPTGIEVPQVLRVPLVDRIEELVVLQGPETARQLEYELTLDTTVVESRKTEGGWVEFWSDDAPYLRLNAIEAMDAAGRIFQGQWEIEGPLEDAAGPEDGASGSTYLARVRVNLDGAEFPVVVDPGWSSTGSMATAREFHTATPLPSGKILVAGGWNNSTAFSSCEIYDPGTGTWSSTGSMSTARLIHTGTLLPSGKVLIASGYNGTGGYVASCELYDPVAGTWTATGSLATARQEHTATLLASGRVMVAGGTNGGALVSCEIYDPVTGVWSATGSLATGRFEHSVTSLPTGKLLASGGFDGATSLDSCEIYDPVAGTWGPTGSLAGRRRSHGATLLPSGKVLAFGGNDGVGIYLASCELFDPAAGTWTSTGSLLEERGVSSAALLPSGRVLAVGGSNPSWVAPQFPWTPDWGMIGPEGGGVHGEGKAVV